ncbi:MAG: hypothetical protein QOI26_735 [Pseudonocardiales bacterium]|nr:hypothetical protein [Pseudonocardiales bacterium]
MEVVLNWTLVSGYRASKIQGVAASTLRVHALPQTITLGTTQLPAVTKSERHCSRTSLPDSDRRLERSGTRPT